MYLNAATLTNSNPEPQPLKFVCRICRRPEEIPTEMMREARLEFAKIGMEPILPTICNRCDDELKTPRNKNVEGQIIKYAPPSLDVLLDRYQEKKRYRPPLRIPSGFLDTDPNHPEIDRKRFQQVVAYKPSKKSLLVRGESGAGKSRAGWTLLSKLWGEGYEVMAYDAARLVEEYEEKIRNGWGPYFMKTLLRVPVLMIDDIGNEQRGESIIFSLVKGRNEKGRPIIAITQHTSETLYANTRNPQRVAALLRRLKDRDHFIDAPFVKPKINATQEPATA